MRLSAVPALLDAAECEAAIRALAEDLEGLDRGAARRGRAAPDCRDDGVPCGGQGELSADAARRCGIILDELRRTAYSSVCPHGRPVVLRLTRREIEKNFQRI